MDEVVEARKTLKEYGDLQAELCDALFVKYGPVKDDLLLNIPRFGSVEVKHVVWSFKKHGAGVLFERLSDRLIVDAHQYMGTCPTCVDAWRLTQYLESRSIRRMNVGTQIFDTQDEASVLNILTELLRLGWAVKREGINTFEVI
jgi:hypothetical protein